MKKRMIACILAVCLVASMGVTSFASTDEVDGAGTTVTEEQTGESAGEGENLTEGENSGEGENLTEGENSGEGESSTEGENSNDEKIEGVNPAEDENKPPENNEEANKLPENELLTTPEEGANAAVSVETIGVDVVVRPDGANGETLNFAYDTAYKKAGATISGTTITVDKRLLVYAGAAAGGSDKETAYYGIKISAKADDISKLTGAEKFQITNTNETNADKRIHTLEGGCDGNGNIITYIPFAKKMADNKWVILAGRNPVTVDWFNNESAVIATATFTITVAAKETAAPTMTFVRNNTATGVSMDVSGTTATLTGTNVESGWGNVSGEIKNLFNTSEFYKTNNSKTFTVATVKFANLGARAKIAQKNQAIAVAYPSDRDLSDGVKEKEYETDSGNLEFSFLVVPNEDITFEVAPYVGDVLGEATEFTITNSVKFAEGYALSVKANSSLTAKGLSLSSDLKLTGTADPGIPESGEIFDLFKGAKGLNKLTYATVNIGVPKGFSLADEKKVIIKQKNAALNIGYPDAFSDNTKTKEYGGGSGILVAGTLEYSVLVYPGSDIDVTITWPAGTDSTPTHFVINTSGVKVNATYEVTLEVKGVDKKSITDYTVMDASGKTYTAVENNGYTLPAGTYTVSKETYVSASFIMTEASEGKTITVVLGKPVNKEEVTAAKNQLANANDVSAQEAAVKEVKNLINGTTPEALMEAKSDMDAIDKTLIDKNLVTVDSSTASSSEIKLDGSIGVALNAVAEDKSAASIKIEKTGDDKKVADQLIDNLETDTAKVSETAQADITLMINSSDVSELKAPLTLTLTLPDGWNVSKNTLRILHKHADKSVEEITNFTVSGNQVTFTVTKLSTFAFVKMASTVTPTPTPTPTPSRPGTPSSSGGSSSSERYGTPSVTSGGTSGKTSSKTSAVSKPLTSSEAQKAAASAVSKAVSSGSATANVSLRNITTVAPDVMGTIASAAGKKGIEATVLADTMTKDGKSIEARIYVDAAAAAKLRNPLNLAAHAGDKTVFDHFAQYYDNSMAVVKLDQEGAFGMTVQVAVKLDLTGLDVSKLVFYSYDLKTNSYSRIAEPKFFIDNNGYLHFNTTLGGRIIVSEGPLARK